MKSHTCEFETKDLLRLIGWPLLPLLAFALVMRGSLAFHALPKPRPTLDIDRTILIHQAEACQSIQSAAILLLGDSSCLMDVSATQLGERLGQTVLNVGTLSYLDLNAYALMLRKYVAANPRRLRAVVLLMHPEALRRAAPETFHVNFLQSVWDGTDSAQETTPFQKASSLLGFEAFRARLLSRVLPTPLSGAYGRHYGFSADLEKFLTAHHGSAIDPDPQPFQGNAEYRLAPQLEIASRNFKSAVPRGVSLLVGITPAPVGFVSRNHAWRQGDMLEVWGRWLQADEILKELPPALPDKLFTKTTHLSETGVATYTDLLGQALEKSLPK